MAVFTPLSFDDAVRICKAHNLGDFRNVVPIPQGSVNSNYFVDTTNGRFFVRIYEEQEVDGVEYEWHLLQHLQAAKIPVPRRIEGPGPGELRVAGKPTAVFELVGGSETCQAGVTSERAHALGALLGHLHQAGERFRIRRASRFALAQIEARLDSIANKNRSELSPIVDELRACAQELGADWHNGLTMGVIHGDLFRDNIRWDGNHIVAAIDWESASDGPIVYDIMVTVLAWCFSNSFDWELAKQLLVGYQSTRALSSTEAASLRTAGIAAALRFTVTRITDFYLRTSEGPRVYKDYQRFLARLRELQALPVDELKRRLHV